MSEEPKKKLISEEAFWMLFSFALCLIVLYMALTFNSAVNDQVKAITISKCSEIYANSTIGRLISIPQSSGLPPAIPGR